MAIDFSKLNSIYSSNFGTSASNSISANKTSTSFMDYLLKANSTSDKLNDNSIFSTLTTTNSSSILQSLLTNGANTNHLSSYLDKSTSNDFTNDTGTTDAFSNYLQSQFQASQLKMLNSAKSNLEAQMTTFIEKNADNTSAAAKARIEEMQQNISMLDQYISKNTTNASTENSLLNALSANASLTQYLVSKNNS